MMYDMLSIMLGCGLIDLDLRWLISHPPNSGVVGDQSEFNKIFIDHW